MKRFLSVAMFIAAVVALAFYLMLPPRGPAPDTTSLATPQDTPAVTTIPTSPGTETAAEEERRVEAMQVAFAALEKSRNDLRRLLGKLKAQLWNLKVPAAEANRISDEMRNGYALLKNPPMLGAFANSEEIRRETDRVMASLETLGEIEKLVLEKLAADPAQE